MVQSPTYIPYQPYCHKDTIHVGTGHVAIVCGWTPVDKMLKLLRPEDYNCLGNLYSAVRGINPLIRNLLANKHIHDLIIIHSTQQDENTGACQCLIDFFRHGATLQKVDYDREVWRINSEVEGYIDASIPSPSLEALRQNITIYNIDSPQSLRQLSTLLNAINTQPLRPWGKNETYPIEEVKSDLLPGDRYCHSITSPTIAEAWPEVLYRIRKFGLIRDSLKRGLWQELINLSVTITNEPDSFYFPQPDNYLPFDLSYIQDYCQHLIFDTTTSLDVKYTYGSRLRTWFGVDQIEQIITKLGEQPEAASGTMSLWDPTKDHIGRGSPCLNHIWVRIVKDEIVLVATLRSNDMFSAWASNAMGLRALQYYFRDQLNERFKQSYKVGNLVTVSQSAHIYQDCWEFADRLIEKQYFAPKPQSYLDPCGMFVITLSTDSDKCILIEQFDNEERLVNVYTGTSALKLVRHIAKVNPTIQLDHIGYLGLEVGRAEYALKNHLDYIQDVNIKRQ